MKQSMNNTLEAHNVLYDEVTKESYIDIKFWGLVGLILYVGFFSIITLGFAIPALLVSVEKYICEKKHINGKKLIFTGQEQDLYLLCLNWFILTIITLGIYSLWVGFKYYQWKIKHTSFERSTNIPSVFTGKVSSYILLNLFTFIFSILTLGFGIPYVMCLRKQWLNTNTFINGIQLDYTGRGNKLFIGFIAWIFIAIITIVTFNRSYITIITLQTVNILIVKIFLEWDTKNTKLNFTTNLKQKSLKLLIKDFLRSNKILVLPVLLIIGIFSFVLISNNQYKNNEFYIVNNVLIKYNGNDKHVIIPNGIKKIGKNAFDNNSKIKSVIIPDGVKTIDSSAFISCYSLKVIVIPNSVELIGEDALNYSYNLTILFDKDQNSSLKWEKPTSPNIRVITGEFGFDDKFIYKIEQDNITILYYLGNSSNVIIPSYIEDKKVEKVAAYTFSYNDYLINIELPNTITNIEEYAFLQCSELSFVKLPSNLKVLNKGLFSWCTKLENVEIPSSVTRIESKAFEACYNLENIILPDSVEYIGVEAFSDCKKLKNIIFSNKLRIIDDYAFKNCNSLENVEFPNSLEMIYYRVFTNCYNLKTVWIPISVKEIYKEVFTTKGLTIYCEASNMPSSWNDNWQYYATVVWEANNPN